MVDRDQNEVISGEEPARRAPRWRKIVIRNGLVVLGAAAAISVWTVFADSQDSADAQSPRSGLRVRSPEELAAIAEAERIGPNGFDLSNATIPAEEIRRGGPGRDGIPALLNPRFVPSSAASYLKNEDIVLGLVMNGDARAYPLRILVWHEVANDEVGGVPIIATYCPLCGTAMAFRRTIGQEVRTFGVSGLLYNSDVLMYDHQTESLWSQLKMEAVSGPLVGERLEWIPSVHMTWRAWKDKYPDSMVLSDQTGFNRAYGRMPYGQYGQTQETMFPVPRNRTELKNKEWVAGVIVDGVAKAYPIERLKDGTFSDTIGTRAVRVQYDKSARYLRIVDAATGDEIPSVLAYWFAWQAFYPDTLLYGA